VFSLAAAEAAALEAEQLAGLTSEEVSSAAIRLWATARMRQGLPLETAQLARIALDDPALQTVLAWSDLLSGAAPFQIEGSADDIVEAPLTEAETGSLAAELLAIDGTANGTPCRTIFVDTGAQHTVITRAAAKAAGVRIRPGDIELAGFATATAEAGLIETLQLGSLTIRNVPVLVGDSPALTAAEGSSHGYDVTDPTTISAELGGPEGFERLLGTSPYLTAEDVEADIAEGGVTRVRAVIEKAKSPAANCRIRAASGQPCIGEVQRYYMKLRGGQ